MAHYIGKYDTEIDLRLALGDGSLLEPYVAAVGTGSSVSVYYSSDPNPVQPLVCKYSADTATTISAAGGQYTFSVTANTPFTGIYMNGQNIMVRSEEQTSTGSTITLQISGNTSATENYINIRIDYLEDDYTTVIMSDSFVLTQEAPLPTYLCSAIIVAFSLDPVDLFNSSDISYISKLVIDGVDVGKPETPYYEFTSLGDHTVEYYVGGGSDGSYAGKLFNGISSVASITMGSDIKSLTGAFAQSSPNLTAFTAPNLEKVTYRCFHNTSIMNVNAPKLTEVGNQCFAGCNFLNPNFISGLTVIGNNAFCGSTFTTAVVNSGLTSLGYSAFQMNSALTSCQINGVSGYTSSKFSDSGMFNGCTSLTGFTYPDEWTTSVSTSRYATFKNCSAMTEVTFGTGMTSIGSGMFSVGNSSLVTIKSYAATAPALGGNDFDSITGNTGTLYVPSGSDYSTWSAALGENWTVSGTL